MSNSGTNIQCFTCKDKKYIEVNVCPRCHGSHMIGGEPFIGLCDECNGNDYNDRKPCPECNGSGEDNSSSNSAKYVTNEGRDDTKECQTCYGRGEILDMTWPGGSGGPCPDCNNDSPSTRDESSGTSIFFWLVIFLVVAMLFFNTK